jgi:hypothetical protein
VSRIAGHDRPAPAGRDGRTGDRAGALLETGPPRVDQLTPFGGIVVRKEPPKWHTNELRVAVVSLPISEGELATLQIEVQVVGRVVTQRTQVIALQQLQVL